MVAALVQSDIDAAVIWQPFGWRVEQATSGDIRVISDAEGYFRERIIASTSSAYAASHAAELQAFVRGLAEASRWCIQNRKESASVVAKNLKITDTALRSEEHTSELQSLMRISYAVFCLKKNKKIT